MSYIDIKTIKGHQYAYLRETVLRPDGTYRHPNLQYLGAVAGRSMATLERTARAMEAPKPAPKPIEPTRIKAPTFKGARPSKKILPTVKGLPPEKEQKVIIKRKKKVIKKKLKKKPEEENKDVVV